MTFCEAIDFAEQIRKNQTFAKAKAPRSVEVHSLSNHIACAKIIVWWGVVYALLSRGGDG